MAPARGRAPRPSKYSHFQIARRSSGYPSGAPIQAGKSGKCLSNSEQKAVDRRTRPPCVGGVPRNQPPCRESIPSLPGDLWRRTGRKWRPRLALETWLGPFASGPASVTRRAVSHSDAGLSAVRGKREIVIRTLPR